MEAFVDRYNAEVDRFKRAGMPTDVDRFVKTDDIKWDGTLKDHLKACIHAKFATGHIRDSLFRPYSAKMLYHDTFFLNRIYLTKRFLPTSKQQAENRLIVVSDLGYRAKAPSVLCTNLVPDLHLCATSDSHQCYPFYVYDVDGTNRRENITDWALKQFREKYQDQASRSRERPESGATSADADRPDKLTEEEKEQVLQGAKRDLQAIADFEVGRIKAVAPEPTAKSRSRKTPVADATGSPATSASAKSYDSPKSVAHASGSWDARKITKWDIFHYVYGLLHHPGYRTKYADNLKRELPRIPFAPDFWSFADAGKKLADLHLNYEEHDPFDLKYVTTTGVPMSYRVEKMKLSADKSSLKVNESLTLAGIPPEVFEYRLGNRSALDWVIDQYRVTEDSRSGIVSDPNREDDEDYIVKLVGRVVAVSVETVKIVKGLPAEFGG